MEDWLREKRLAEAQKMAQLKNYDKNEQLDRMAKHEENAAGYKEWLKVQEMREK